MLAALPIHMAAMVAVWAIKTPGCAADVRACCIASDGSGAVVQVLVRSVLANWLVCMAFWLANGANSMVGKIIGIWFPISAFAAMGLEHRSVSC